MKNPIHQPITRASLLATATCNSRWFARLLAGTAVLGSTALAVDNLWTGAVDKDWNKPGNWSLNRVPAQPNGQPTGDTFDDAIIRTLNNFPLITTNLVAVPRDIVVGGGSGNTGRVDHTAGTAANGGGNWSFIGRNGGTGTYNLADTSASGGIYTGFGTGSGTLNIGARLYVGGQEPAGGGNGTFNVNTTNGVTMGSDLAIGASGATGVMNVDAGTITTGGWTFIGKRENQDGGNGTLRMSGGSITHNGTRSFVGLGNAVGTFELAGGTFNNLTGGGDSFFAVGVNNLTNANTSQLNITGGTLNVTRLLSIGGVEPQGGNNNATFVGPGKGTMTVNGSTAVVNVTGEFWAGQGAGSTGTITLNAGAINVNNWIAIGRGTGTGTLNVNGGTLTKTGGGNFIVGAGGPGTMTQTGGVVDVQSGVTWLGENDTATFTLDGGEFRANNVIPAANGSSTATVNLNDGVLRLTGLNGGGGAETVNFNGTELRVASTLSADFIANLDAAVLNDGGLVVNTNGFNASSPQVFEGTAGVTKTGAGTLTLTGKSSYEGTSTVNGGKLVLNTKSTGGGSVSVGSGATLGVAIMADPDDPFSPRQLEVASATFATGSAVEIAVDSDPANPIDAALLIEGAVTLNGPVAVNLTDPFPEVGSYTLIDYGSKSGAGSFVLGTLPLGVVGTINDNGSTVTLNVTSVAQPKWDATNSGNWNDDEVNWVDQASFNPIAFTNGNPVLFNDDVTGATQGAVTITEPVAPATMDVNNSSVPYSFDATGGGLITGTTGLTKKGTSSLALNSSHDYTGVTRIEGGTVSIPSIADGGDPSPIGASAADPANLSLGGGTLDYTGAAATTDRGFSISATNNTITSTINNANDLTFTGPVTVPTFGRLQKTGAGNLTLSNAGANQLGIGDQSGLQVNGGTLTLQGSGTQTNQVNGDVWVGSVPGASANLVLNASSLSTGGWLSVGRGNGSGAVSSLTATSSTLQTGNMSTGFAAGLPDNDSDQAITLTDTNWNITGQVILAENTASNTTLTLNGASVLSTGGSFRAALGDSDATIEINGTSALNSGTQLQLALNADAVVNVTVNDSGSITKTGGWFSIGNDGTGTLTVNDNGTVVSNGDFNISDVGTSNGTLTVNDSASVTSNGRIFIGKGAETIGTINQTGGTITAAEWISGGRSAGSQGFVNVSGGLFQQMDAGAAFFIAEAGTGTATLSGTGQMNVAGNLVLADVATAVGTFNLDAGGTLTVKQIFDGNGGAGAGTFNFDGGLLRARENADLDFMVNLEAVNVEDGGANIDTNGKEIRIFPNLLDAGGGGLVKTGAGTLRLNGADSTYSGATQVNTGALGGTGRLLNSDVTVANGASLTPGDATGTLVVKSATFAAGGKLTATFDGAASGVLETTGNLNITNATLELNGTPTAQSYVIARYGSLTGTQFAAINPALPPEYTITYGATEIIIERPASGGYTDWIETYFPGETDPAIIGQDADPDGDGGSNRFEFALGGLPNDPASKPKVFPITLDSSDEGSVTEMLLTIAVRTGTPALEGTPSPTATNTEDDITYTVQGSTDLADFTATVTPVNMVPPPVDPGLPDGYEYRTFSLSGSDGLPTKGFLRVQVTP